MVRLVSAGRGGESWEIVGHQRVLVIVACLCRTRMRQKSSCECFVALAAAPETKNVEKIGATACVGLGGGGLWSSDPVAFWPRPG